MGKPPMLNTQILRRAEPRFNPGSETAFILSRRSTTLWCALPIPGDASYRRAKGLRHKGASGNRADEVVFCKFISSSYGSGPQGDGGRCGPRDQPPDIGRITCSRWLRSCMRQRLAGTWKHEPVRKKQHREPRRSALWKSSRPETRGRRSVAFRRASGHWVEQWIE
jgi:hypothetical protein